MSLYPVSLRIIFRFHHLFAGSLTEPEMGSALLFGWISTLELTLTFAVKLKWNASRLTGDTRCSSLSCAASLLLARYLNKHFLRFFLRSEARNDERERKCYWHTQHTTHNSNWTTTKLLEAKMEICDESEGNFHIHNPKKERKTPLECFSILVYVISPSSSSSATCFTMQTSPARVLVMFLLLTWELRSISKTHEEAHKPNTNQRLSTHEERQKTAQQIIFVLSQTEKLPFWCHDRNHRSNKNEV